MRGAVTASYPQLTTFCSVFGVGGIFFLAVFLDCYREGAIFIFQDKKDVGWPEEAFPRIWIGILEWCKTWFLLFLGWLVYFQCEWYVWYWRKCFIEIVYALFRLLFSLGVLFEGSEHFIGFEFSCMFFRIWRRWLIAIDRTGIFRFICFNDYYIKHKPCYIYLTWLASCCLGGFLKCHVCRKFLKDIFSCDDNGWFDADIFGVPCTGSLFLRRSVSCFSLR